jgi:hypothetical protein
MKPDDRSRTWLPQTRLFTAAFSIFVPINSLSLIQGKIFRLRECGIWILRIKLPLFRSFPEKKEKISRSVRMLIYTSFLLLVYFLKGVLVRPI